MSNILQWLFKNFLKGLLIVVPLVVTVYVIYGVFTWIDGLLKVDSWFNHSVPGLGFVITLSIIIIMGAMGSNIVATRLISFLEKYLNRVPLVKLIYFSLKDLIGAFVGEKKSDPFLMPGGIMPTYGELRVNDNVEESPKPKKSHVEFDSSR